jgi:hypothetical protein
MRIVKRETRPIDCKRRVVLPKEFFSEGMAEVEITLYEDKIVISKKK